MTITCLGCGASIEGDKELCRSCSAAALRQTRLLAGIMLLIIGVGCYAVVASI